ncbi:hypothetical protein [Oceanobacter kriegii]|uniref:hypothetical protein n=1 Tax=Oceanobacter kriegii TaxID=64972 RepID=UPI0012EC6999|nr:hypothetical protein [Oceanobacter kriegii]
MKSFSVNGTLLDSSDIRGSRMDIMLFATTDTLQHQDIEEPVFSDSTSSIDTLMIAVDQQLSDALE